jgi:diguanylate cyclase (GGDEF)-like protein
MRAITGWRFLIAIVLPLALATLGAIGLTYDLLSYVEGSSNRAENVRNRVAISEALNSELQELGRLVGENANWEEAWQKTSGGVDTVWFQRSWGRTISVGASYDIAAVVRKSDGAVIVHNAQEGAKRLDIEDLTGTSIGKLHEGMGRNAPTNGPLVGFVFTAFGPAAVSVAPIVNPRTGNSSGERLLVFVRLIGERRLGLLEKQLLISKLTFHQPGERTADDIVLNDFLGNPGLRATWQNLAVGELVTSFAWRKAGMVLGFMIIVVSGIAFVCWRLVQQILLREEEASRESMLDHLTGLSNRHALMAALRSARERPETTFALAFADLDGFKEVNDSYGHEFGDRLICMVAAGIRQLAQGAQVVARMGGDEFVIMYSGIAAETLARQFSERLIKLLSQPVDLEGRLALVGASIGISVSAVDLSETEVLRRADVAMYRAKADGKNRVCRFVESFDSERHETIAIAAELKQIVKARNLEIVFQPFVCAKTGQMTGVEALARWPTTSFSNVQTERFVTVAESSGLIDELGEVILSKACAAAQAWPTLRLAVNISAVQLNNPRFVERALATLASFGIAPARMEFEITETSLIHDAERAQQVFKALQGVGIKVALDDFGTGFSSIGYLRRFNFDRIKIDKSIVNKVLTSPAELAIVQGVLLVAKGLSAEVTAEGVENEDEVKVLHLAGCTELQGFHFHTPLEAHEISDLIAKGRAAASARVKIVA